MPRVSGPTGLTLRGLAQRRRTNSRGARRESDRPAPGPGRAQSLGIGMWVGSGRLLPGDQRLDGGDGLRRARAETLGQLERIPLVDGREEEAKERTRPEFRPVALLEHHAAFRSQPEEAGERLVQLRELATRALL